MTKLIAAALVAIMLLVAAAGCSQPAPDQYESTERNEIIYKSVDGTDLGLDIFYPTRRVYSDNPTVLVIHGGGWISGTRDEFYRDFEPMITELRSRGVTVVGVSYRLAVDGRTWRDCLDDCEDALEFLIDNADSYDIDVDNIGVIGYSAGAQLALMSAVETDDQVKYCVSLSAPTVFSDSKDSKYYSEALSYYISRAFDNESQYDMYKASPIILLSRRCKTDFLIVNGSDDVIIPPAHSEAFYNEAMSFGIDAELMIVDGLTHIYPMYPDFAQLCSDIADRIIENLTD